MSSIKRRKRKIANKLKKGRYLEKSDHRRALNSLYRRILKDSPTKAELIVQIYLEKIGVRAIFQKGFLKPFHRIVDFYIPSLMLIIEVDGNSHRKTRKNDRIKDERWFNERDMDTLRITNQQVYSGKFKEMLDNEVFGN